MATSIKLPTRRVGQTEVSAIGYGAMGISSFYGSAPPDQERFKVCRSQLTKFKDPSHANVTVSLNSSSVT